MVLCAEQTYVEEEEEEEEEEVEAFIWLHIQHIQ